MFNALSEGLAGLQCWREVCAYFTYTRRENVVSVEGVKSHGDPRTAPPLLIVTEGQAVGTGWLGGSRRGSQSPPHWGVGAPLGWGSRGFNCWP